MLNENLPKHYLRDKRLHMQRQYRESRSIEGTVQVKQLLL